MTTTPTRPVHLVICDDHPIFRDGLRRLLESEPGFAVIGEAANPRDAVTAVRVQQPDVLLLDLMMPGGGGLAALRQLFAEPTQTRIVLLTAAIERNEQLDPVAERHSRMRVEGDDRRPPAGGERRVEHAPVPEVDAVEGAEGSRPRLRLGPSDLPGDLHSRASAASAGRSRAGSASSTRNGPTSVRRSVVQWPPSAVAIARTRLGFVHAAREMMRVGELLFTAAGTSGVFRSVGIERRVRDLHIARLFKAYDDSIAEGAGRILLGLDPQGEGW